MFQIKTRLNISCEKEVNEPGPQPREAVHMQMEGGKRSACADTRVNVTTLRESPRSNKQAQKIDQRKKRIDSRKEKGKGEKERVT